MCVSSISIFCYCLLFFAVSLNFSMLPYVSLFFLFFPILASAVVGYLIYIHKLAICTYNHII